MKALLIAPQPFYSARGTPFSVYYRTLVMAEMGVEVDLLTYGQGQDVEIPGVRIIQIADVPSLGLIKTGPSTLKLFLDVFILLRTIGLLIRNNNDFGHAHEEAVFFCRFLKPLFGFKPVYDMHSSLPQQLTNFNFTKSKFLIGMFKYLEDGALAHAEVVLTICPDLAESALSRAPIEDRHILIENSILEPIKFRKTIEETVSADKPTELPPTGESSITPERSRSTRASRSLSGLSRSCGTIVPMHSCLWLAVTPIRSNTTETWQWSKIWTLTACSPTPCQRCWPCTTSRWHRFWCRRAPWA